MMEEIKIIEQKAWLALQRGHYQNFGKLAEKWRRVNFINHLLLDDPFASIRRLAQGVRI